MITSYDPKRDVLNAYCAVVTPNDSTELRNYGKLLFTNSKESSIENVTVMMASNNTDDTTSVSFPIAPATTILFPVVVRRILRTGTGVDIKVVLIA